MHWTNFPRGLVRTKWNKYVESTYWFTECVIFVITDSVYVCVCVRVRLITKIVDSLQKKLF